MSREIKFRAWSVKTKEMAGHFEDGFNYRWFECEDDCHILMQYTGLHDKNGKEIYEGDICKYYDSEPADKELWNATTPDSDYRGEWVDIELIGKVKWDDETAGYTVGGTKWWDEKVEVIGNIYENPELLK